MWSDRHVIWVASWEKVCFVCWSYRFQRRFSPEVFRFKTCLIFNQNIVFNLHEIDVFKRKYKSQSKYNLKWISKGIKNYAAEVTAYGGIIVCFISSVITITHNCILKSLY